MQGYGEKGARACDYWPGSSTQMAFATALRGVINFRVFRFYHLRVT
jgi:hypothetical protein